MTVGQAAPLIGVLVVILVLSLRALVWAWRLFVDELRRL